MSVEDDISIQPNGAKPSAQDQPFLVEAPKMRSRFMVLSFLGKTLKSIFVLAAFVAVVFGTYRTYQWKKEYDAANKIAEQQRIKEEERLKLAADKRQQEEQRKREAEAAIVKERINQAKLAAEKIAADRNKAETEKKEQEALAKAEKLAADKKKRDEEIEAQRLKKEESMRSKMADYVVALERNVALIQQAKASIPKLTAEMNKIAELNRLVKIRIDGSKQNVNVKVSQYNEEARKQSKPGWIIGAPAGADIPESLIPVNYGDIYMALPDRGYLLNARRNDIITAVKELRGWAVQFSEHANEIKTIQADIDKSKKFLEIEKKVSIGSIPEFVFDAKVKDSIKELFKMKEELLRTKDDFLKPVMQDKQTAQKQVSKTFVLADGRKIQSAMVVDGDDAYSIKTINGEFVSVKKVDVKEIVEDKK